MSSPLPGNGEDIPDSLLTVSGGAVGTDDHFLDDLLARPTGIIRVVLLAFARFIGADKRVGPATIRVLLATPLNDKVLAGNTRRNDTPTQLTDEHGNEPIDGPSGWLMSRSGCTPHRRGGTEERCSGSCESEQRKHAIGVMGQLAGGGTSIGCLAKPKRAARRETAREGHGWEPMVHLSGGSRPKGSYRPRGTADEGDFTSSRHRCKRKR